MPNFPNYGLLTNIAGGIKEAMAGYQTTKQMQMQQQQNQMLQQTAGFQQDASGNMTMNPERQQELENERKAKGLLYKRQIGEETGGSPESLAEESFYKQMGGQLGQGEHISAAELQRREGLLLKKQQAEAMMKYRETMLGNQGKRLTFQSDKEARAAANNDPLLKQFMPRLEGAAKIKELIGAARTGQVVSNQALLGQLNAEISRLETGSQAPGLHSAEKTELLSRAAQIKAFTDSFTGKPTDSVSPEILNTADKMVGELSNSYMSGIDSRMDFLKGGASDTQQEIFNQKHKSIKDQYGKRFGHWGEEKFQDQGAPSSGGAKGLLTSPPSAANSHPQDDVAIAYAKAHPQDPRSVAILKANGAR